MLFQNKSLPFWIITISTCIILIVPLLVQEGMFMDGLLYLSVSKNLAQDIGTFWEPIFSYSWERSGSGSFHEQPPLGFGIQAVFYKIFGLSIYVERFYSFLTACTSAWLIIKIWKLPVKENLANTTWLPILLWIIIPITYWSYHNNILENTLSIFTLSSVFFILKGLITKKRIYLNFLIGGIFIFLASFTKGIPGLFPLITIAAYWIAFKKESFYKILKWSFIPLLILCAIYFILLIFNSEAYNSLEFYFNERLVGRVYSMPTVDNRLWIIYRLLLEIIPFIALGTLALIVNKKKKIISKSNYQNALFFAIIGMSASLPLTITLTQRTFYFTPAIPFLAISTAFLIGPFISQWVRKITIKSLFYKVILTASIVFLFLSLMVSFIQIGKTKRDHEIISDFKILSNEIPHNSCINVEPSIKFQVNIEAYAMRYNNLHLFVNHADINYFLLRKGTPPFSSKHVLIETEMTKFELYKRNPNE